MSNCNVRLILLHFALLISAMGGKSQSHNILSRVFTRLGDSLELNCVSLRPSRDVKICRWEQELGTFLEVSSARTSAHAGYTGNQAALRQGDCIMIIQSVDHGDATKWNCTAIDMENQPHHGTVDVVLTSKPSPPVILDKNKFWNLVDIEGGAKSSFNSTCCTRNGCPPPELKLIFRNQTYSSLGQVGIDEIGDCLFWPSVDFDWRDNGQMLKCEAKHEDYDGSDNVDSIQLNVLYSPRILTTDLIEVKNHTKKVYRLPHLTKKLKTWKSINFTYSSNPISSVVWTPTDVSTINFTAEIRQISKWIWVTVLTFDINQLRDGGRAGFLLTVENPVGRKLVRVEIIGSPPAPLVQTQLPSWIFLFIILIVGNIVLVVALCSIIICRRNAWLCFRRRAGEYETRSRRNQLPDGPKATGMDISLPLVQMTNEEHNWQYPGDSLHEETGEFEEAETAEVYRRECHSV